MILNDSSSSNFNSYGLKLGSLGRAFNCLEDKPKKNETNVKSDLKVVFSFNIICFFVLIKIKTLFWEINEEKC